MRTRVEQHFAYNQTARHLEQMCDQLIQQVSSGTGTSGTTRFTDLDEPLAQVA
jgi:hypothetical protein